MAQFVKAWFTVYRRRPTLALVALFFALLEVCKWLVQEMLGDEVFDLLRHSKAAMDTLHLIAAHWGLVPWCLVPLSLAISAIWGAANARKIMAESMLPRERLDDKGLHDQARSWLESRLSDRKLLVEHAHLFGSVVHDHYSTSDVDVAVTFKAASEKKIGKAGRRLRGEVAQDFKRTFGHRLHFQFFCAQEAEDQNQFLGAAGKYERLDIH